MRLNRKKILLVSIFSVLLLLGIYGFRQNVKASPTWLSGWNYRKMITINGTTDGAQSNYQMKLIIYKSAGTDATSNVYLGTKVKDDFADIRFTKADGHTLLGYWIESYTSGASSTVWIEFDSISESPDTATFYIYYNYADAVSASSGGNTFILFDDFDAWSDAKWGIQPAWATLSGGILTIMATGAVSTDNKLSSVATFGLNTAIYIYNRDTRGGTSGSDVCLIGFSSADLSTDLAAIYQDNVYTGTFYGAMYKASVRAWPNTGITKTANWVVTEVRRKSASLTELYKDSTIYSYTTFNYITTASVPVMLRVGNAAGKTDTMEVDYVFVRNITTNEPTWGAWGSEESAATGYEMASTNYRIWESSVNSGGMDNQTSTSYRLRESIGEAVAGESTSTSYKLKMGYQPMLESYISLSVSTTSVQILPNIGGITGGTATGSYSATVITDNPAGYSLFINASTTPAMKSGSYSFADYTIATANIPDYTWSILATTSEFGFSPEGADITQTFKDNGSDCATSTQDTADKCWYNFATTTRQISQVYSANYPSGGATTIKLQAQAGSSRMQEEGTYSAQITTTAVAN